MNYYHRYPGHYIAKTLHLSMEEDGAYNRLMDWMYLNEKPVPHAERYAIARAMKLSERRAVDKVLAEYFECNGKLYKQGRTEEEIAKNQPRIQAARENGRNGGRPRKTETQEKPSGLENENPVGSPEKPRAKAPQTPNTSITPESLSLADPPSPVRAHVSAREESAVGGDGGGSNAPQASSEAPQRPPAPPPATTPHTPTRAGLACRLMRQAGCVQTNPSHPDLLAAIAEGVTPEALADTAREAVEKQAGRPFAWAIATARSRHAQGARTTTAGTSHDRQRPVTAVIANLRAKHGTSTFDLSGFADDDPAIDAA